MENKIIKIGKKRIKIKMPIKKAITVNNILAHTKEIADRKYIPIPHLEVLNQLLENIPAVDFRKIAKLKEGEKLQTKHYVVGVIDMMIKTAKQYKWHLMIQNDFTYLYNGAFWKVIERKQLKSFLGECALKMGVNKIDAKYHMFRAQLEKQFDAVGYIFPISPNKKTLINLSNGTFEISETKQFLRVPDYNDFLKYQLSFPYDEKAQYPKWQKFLDRVQPNKEIQQVLQEYIGYLFTRHMNLETVLLLYGNGANGKSVFIDVICAMLGKDNVSHYSLETLTKEGSYERADLQNKLLNAANEISGRLQSDTFKQLASNQPIGVRKIFGSPYIMEDYAKLIFACNELPREVEQTHGFYRRWKIILFEQVISAEEKNIELANEIIAEELSGVFNWALEGLQRLLLNKDFTVCDVIENQNAEFRKQADSVAMWMEEFNYIPSTELHETLQRLFDEYNGFCKACNYRAIGRTKFGERLRKYGFEIEKKNSGRIVYVEQKSVEEDEKNNL